MIKKIKNFLTSLFAGAILVIAAGAIIALFIMSIMSDLGWRW